MRVLVTGGMGYLGCVLVRKLCEKGHNVRMLDSLLYGNNLGNQLDFELIKGDIRDKDTLSKSLDGMDAVIHLAAIVGEPAGNLDKELTVNINYLATRRLAELCSKGGVKLVFSSTCSVYGARPNELINEKFEILPLSLYAISKLAAEESIEKLQPDSIILRLGTLFGYSPKMRFDLVVNRFIAQAMQHEKITVFGGSQYRPFLHVQDAVDAFVKSVNSNKNGLFNLGGINYRIIEVANIIQKKTDCEVVVFSEIRDPRNYAVDSSLAIKSLEVEFRRDIGYAIDEIKTAYENGSVKNYKDAIYSDEEWLRRLMK